MMIVFTMETSVERKEFYEEHRVSISCACLYKMMKL